MLPHLLDVSIRSLILALIAFLFLAIAGRRRTAALQHAVLATVVCGMLALFSFGSALPRLPLRILNAPALANVTPRPIPADRPPLDFALPAIARPVTSQPRTFHWQDLALYAYLAVALAFLAHFLTGMFLARKLLARARPVALGVGNVCESPTLAVPVALGPKILLPVEWRSWDSAKLDAVLAHERAHVRRRDGLIAALAGLNRCLFWFHPVAWILVRRLSLLAEQACDDACVAELGDPDRYARLLLEMASVVGGAHGHALTMAAPSHIRQRIDALLDDRRTFSRGLTATAWASVLLCAIPLVLCAGIVKFDRQPPTLSLDAPHLTVPAPPLLIAQNQTPAPPAAPAITPRFDDVSVKPCAEGDGAGRGGRGGEGGRGIPPSPNGEIYIHCLSVVEIINIAADLGDLKLLNDPGGPNALGRVQGGPAWISTDLWTIDAKTTDPVASHWNLVGSSPTSRIFKGTMTVAMLEEQFRLRTHRKVEEVPMYSLTLAPGGPGLQPTPEDGCIRINPDGPHVASDFAPVNGKPVCVQGAGWEGPNWTINAAGQPLDRLVRTLPAFILDRPVLDKTGLTGQYTYHLKFAHDQFAPGRFPSGMNPFTAPTADDPLAPTLNTVLEQELGLTLVPDKGPREFIVIDSAARPPSN